MPQLPRAWVQGRGIAWLVRWARQVAFVRETRMRRAYAVDRYCRGEGIEIGAAASPAIVPPGARVRYVDKYPYDVIAADPELAGLRPVTPDLVTSGDRLEGVPNESQDFVLAFSLLEHVQDPLGAFAAFARVLRPGGVIVCSVPDKTKYRPDRERPLTTLEHLLRDHREGPEGAREGHFRECGALHLGLRGEALERYVREGLAGDAHCHFHVWDGPSFLRFVLFAIDELRLPIQVVEFATYGHESMCVLRRGSVGALDNPEGRVT